MADAWTMGLAIPLTGSLGAIGTSVLHGARVARETLQAEGARVELAVEDTAGEPANAASVVQGFVDGGVPVVGGPISSDVALRVRAVAERTGVPHLPAMGGNPDVTEPGTRYTFRFSSSNRQSGLGTVAFFRSRSVDRIAIVGADYSYPRAVTAAIREFGAERGLSVDSAQFVSLGTRDFGAVLDRIDTAAIGGVFVPHPGRAVVDLLGRLSATEAFEDRPVLGDYSIGSAPYRQRLGEDIEGTFNWGVDTGAPAARALDDRVRRRFDEPTGVYHHFGYDIVGIAASAVDRATDTTAEAIGDALRDLEYDAVSGWGVAFDENGRNERYRLFVNEWVDGTGLRNEVSFRSGPLSAA